MLGKAQKTKYVQSHQLTQQVNVLNVFNGSSPNFASILNVLNLSEINNFIPPEIIKKRFSDDFMVNRSLLIRSKYGGGL